MNPSTFTSAVAKARLPLAATAGAVALFAGLALSGPGPASPPLSPASASNAYHQPEQRPGEAFRRTELYFGSARPDGKPPVTDAQFDAFVDKYVTPRFPDGLTQLTGEGQFNGSTGPIEETSFVVILLYPIDDRAANKEIEAIRKDYRRLFQQESVLRADSTDRVSF
jgi:hypothetical protein